MVVRRKRAGLKRSRKSGLRRRKMCVTDFTSRKSILTPLKKVPDQSSEFQNTKDTSSSATAGPDKKVSMYQKRKRKSGVHNVMSDASPLSSQSHRAPAAFHN
jgi:hypothetical protein